MLDSGRALLHKSAAAITQQNVPHAFDNQELIMFHGFRVEQWIPGRPVGRPSRNRHRQPRENNSAALPTQGYVVQVHFVYADVDCVRNIRAPLRTSPVATCDVDVGGCSLTVSGPDNFFRIQKSCWRMLDNDAEQQLLLRRALHS